MLGFVQNISPTQLIFILAIILLLFGAKRLPELARSFGKSLKEFKHATKDIEEDFRSAMDEDEPVKRQKPKVKKEKEKSPAYAAEKNPPEPEVVKSAQES